MIAVCFALTGFTAAVLIGWLYAHNSASVILSRAIGIMLVCYVIGRILGGIAQQVIEQEIVAYRKAHPIPSDEIEADAAEPASAAPAQSANQPREAQPAADASRASSAATQQPGPDRGAEREQHNGERPREAAAAEAA